MSLNNGDSKAEKPSATSTNASDPVSLQQDSTAKEGEDPYAMVFEDNAALMKWLFTHVIGKPELLDLIDHNPNRIAELFGTHIDPTPEFFEAIQEACDKNPNTQRFFPTYTVASDENIDDSSAP